MMMSRRRPVLRGPAVWWCVRRFRHQAFYRGGLHQPQSLHQCQPETCCAFGNGRNPHACWLEIQACMVRYYKATMGPGRLCRAQSPSHLSTALWSSGGDCTSRLRRKSIFSPADVEEERESPLLATMGHFVSNWNGK